MTTYLIYLSTLSPQQIPQRTMLERKEQQSVNPPAIHRISQEQQAQGQGQGQAVSQQGGVPPLEQSTVKAGGLPASQGTNNSLAALLSQNPVKATAAAIAALSAIV